MLYFSYCLHRSCATGYLFHRTRNDACHQCVNLLRSGKGRFRHGFFRRCYRVDEAYEPAENEYYEIHYDENGRHSDKHEGKPQRPIHILKR